MRVTAIILENGACYHRIVLPLTYMEGVEVRTLIMNLDEPMDSWADDSAMDCDMVVYSRALEGYVLKWVAGHREKYGFKIWVDVDDHWELGGDHILYERKKETFFQLVQIGHIQYADIVTTTHERLAGEIRQYNTNVHILPNAIPKEGQFLVQRDPSDLVRLFWQGTRTHLKDLGILEKPIIDLAKISGKIKMVIGGVETSDDKFPLWQQMIDIYTAGRRHNNAYIQGEPPVNYYAMYKLADICLVPLVHNRFNRFKSNLKVLESANMGLPAVVSQVHPYLSMPVFYCMRGSDWVEHITKLVASPQLRMDSGETLREWADDNYNFNKINKERRQILEYASSKQGHIG